MLHINSLDRIIVVMLKYSTKENYVWSDQLKSDVLFIVKKK